MQEPLPEDCEPTGLQSKQKHSYLEAYLRVWTENVLARARKTGKHPVSLSIVDLYAAKGWCHDAESGKTWAGSAILAARCWRDYATPYPRRLILNSFHHDGDARVEQHRSLRKALMEEGLAPNGAGITITKLAVREAVQAAKALLNPKFPTIWILDPYKPADLPWEVVESVLGFTAQYLNPKTGTMITRRPEVFITFMTHALQRNLPRDAEWPEHAVREVSAAVGLPVEEWRPIFERHMASTGNTRDALIELYKDRLEAVYGKRPHHEWVRGVDGNHVYAVIFCSQHPAGYYGMLKVAKPHYEAWQTAKFAPMRLKVQAQRKARRREARQNKAVERRAQANHGLDEFF